MVKSSKQELEIKQEAGIKLLRVKDLIEKTGMSRSHIYRMVISGDIPTPIKLSKGIVVWNATDIEDWLRKKFETAREK